jgi:acetoin utilization deacetylase AcuC-like enzyme
VHHGVERVAVIDFDVHHGNGTQETPSSMRHCVRAMAEQNFRRPSTT